MIVVGLFPIIANSTAICGMRSKTGGILVNFSSKQASKLWLYTKFASKAKLKNFMPRFWRKFVMWREKMTARLSICLIWIIKQIRINYWSTCRRHHSHEWSAWALRMNCNREFPYFRLGSQNYTAARTKYVELIIQRKLNSFESDEIAQVSTLLNYYCEPVPFRYIRFVLGWIHEVESYALLHVRPALLHRQDRVGCKRGF